MSTFALLKVKFGNGKILGPVVQLVRMPPCHGGGRGFESRPARFKPLFCLNYAGLG